MRTKIDFGIDLGTTNSAIARIENGEPVIKKTDIQKDIMPSCVMFDKKQAIRVGETASSGLRREKLNAMKNWNEDNSNTFIEFKRTMGTDKTYFSSNMNREYLSEELSAEVLKTLKSYIPGENLKSIVITVPAKFTINQKDATKRAAILAGFNHCELLQEPIAASMAYGLDSVNKDGMWLVFDFGGGTFDAALLRVVDGIMKVFDTEGDNYLGGKNIDFAIVDEIIIPYLKSNYSIQSILDDDQKHEVLREAMKYYAEETKIQLSFKSSHNILSDLGEFPGKDDEGNEIDLDITVSENTLSKVVKPIFQKAIDICLQLLKRNGLSGNDLGVLILVGGPTYSPILRKMLQEQITNKIDNNVDPMTVVAKGAALYASTVNISDELIEQTRDRSKIQLGLGYEPTTVEKEEFVTIKILKNKSDQNILKKLFVELVRADKAWSSGKLEVDETGDVIETKLNEGKANTFNIYIYDEHGSIQPSEPGEITIIQGSKIGSSTLPYNIGIEINNKVTGRSIIKGVKGLEKNQSMPATGTTNGLKTQKDLRPGLIDDYIRIAIYEVDEGAMGSRAIYNQHVFTAKITGEDLPKLLPIESEVDLSIKINDSKISLSAYFPLLEYTHEVQYESKNEGEIDSNWLESEINKAKHTTKIIKEDSTGNNSDQLNSINEELSEFEKLLEQGKFDYDRKKQVLDNLRRTLRKLDELQDSADWPKTETQLKESYYRLEETFGKVEGKLENINDTRIKDAIAQFKEQIPKVIKEKNVKVAKQLIDHVNELDFMLYSEAMGARLEIQLLNEFNDDFDIHDWNDKVKARMLINQGLQIANSNPTREKLRPIVIELFRLLPDSSRPPWVDETILTE